jgi:predicted house-cleaning noncanonical NTP pyrophosphatase (MazG superfamily)
MTPEEIEELRQDTKNAQKSATYLALLSQIKRLDLSKAKQLQDVEQKKTEKTNKKMK